MQAFWLSHPFVTLSHAQGTQYPAQPWQNIPALVDEDGSEKGLNSVKVLQGLLEVRVRPFCLSFFPLEDLLRPLLAVPTLSPLVFSCCEPDAQGTRVLTPAFINV